MVTPLSLQNYIKGNKGSWEIKLHKEHDQNIPRSAHRAVTLFLKSAFQTLVTKTTPFIKA